MIESILFDLVLKCMAVFFLGLALEVWVYGIWVLVSGLWGSGFGFLALAVLALVSGLCGSGLWLIGLLGSGFWFIKFSYD